MEYRYEVPIVVMRYEDEDSEPMPIKKSVTDFVVQHISLSPWRDFFDEDVVDVKVEPRKDRLMIQVVDMQPYDVLNDELWKLKLQDWCWYGYFDSGYHIPGRYYGYNCDEVVIYLSDDQLPIVSKTKMPKVENEH